MSASKNLRARRTRRSASFMHLECLEQRLPLAGNVTAELTDSTLRLTGDDLANQIVVASVAGGRIALIGQNTTINGSPTVFVTDSSVTNIVAKLKGGDDAIGFGNDAQDIANHRMYADFMIFRRQMEFMGAEGTAPVPPFDVPALQSAIDEVAGGVTTFSLPGNLAVTTDSGNDAIGISGDVGGWVFVRLGSADAGNAMAIGSEFSTSRIGGALKIVGGNQNDHVMLANVRVARHVSAELGDGRNELYLAASDAEATSIGTFVYTGGANDDHVMLSGTVDVRNDARISTGSSGEDSVVFYEFYEGATVPSVKVGGDAVIVTGTGNDRVDLIGDIRGSLSVTTGDGMDAVTMSSWAGWSTWGDNESVAHFDSSYAEVPSSQIGRNMTIDTGEGRDLISIRGASVGLKAEIAAGAGADHVRIDGIQVRGNVFARLGRGDDVLEIMALTASAAFLEGGLGGNSLSMDAATLTVSHKIIHRRFQVVTNG